jgi:hypothetical protein
MATKFNLLYFELKLKMSATARNYKTMLKLIAIADETESNPWKLSIFAT